MLAPRRHAFPGIRNGWVALVLLLQLGACGGDQSVVLPPQQGTDAEIAPRVSPIQRAADLEHQRLLAAFGGEYRAPAVRAALEEIVQRLAKASEGQIGSY